MNHSYGWVMKIFLIERPSVLQMEFLNVFKLTDWFGKISEPQVAPLLVKVLNVVACPGIKNVVVVIFGLLNSGGVGATSLFIGLLVNGSRSYNLNRIVYLEE